MHDAPTILLIENDEDGFRCLSTALRAVAPAPRVVWACGTADAAAYLEGRDGYEDRKFFPLPDFVMVDLVTPADSKLDFVRWLRSRNDRLRALPVLGLSAGGDEFEAMRATAAGVTAFFRQPCEPERLTRLMTSIVAHWREGGLSRFVPWPGSAVTVQSCAA